MLTDTGRAKALGSDYYLEQHLYVQSECEHIGNMMFFFLNVKMCKTKYFFFYLVLSLGKFIYDKKKKRKR